MINAHSMQIIDLTDEQERRLFALMVGHVSREALPMQSNPFRIERKCIVDIESKTCVCVLQGHGIDLLPTKYLLTQGDWFLLAEVPWNFRPEVHVIQASGPFADNPKLAVEILRRSLQFGGRFLVGRNPAMAELCNISFSE